MEQYMARPDLAVESLSDALLRVVADGADVVPVPLVGDGTPDASPGRTLVLRLAGGWRELASLDGLAELLRNEDVRVFVEPGPETPSDAALFTDALIEQLLSLGLRAFLVDDSAGRWHEVDADRPWRTRVDDPSAVTVYAVRADRCRSVAAVLHSSGVGGAERSHSELVESLVRQGAMVHTVMPDPDQGLGDLLRRAGSSVETIPPLEWWTAQPGPDAGSSAAWRGERLVDDALIAALESADVEIVLTQTSVVPQGAIAAAALGLPHVWYLREFVDLDHGLAFPAGTAATGDVVLALSDLVLVNSRAVRAHYFGADAPSVHVLSPVPQVPSVDHPRSREGEPWTLGIVGSLNPGKGQADAVRAVALLRAGGLDVRLSLIGPDVAGGLESLQALAEELSVSDLVDFRGVVGGLDEVYAGVDAIAVTSRSEAFGRIPFEATAYSVPVVYAAAGGTVEYMTPDVTGLAYRPGDSAALAAAVRRLHDDPTGATALVATARRVLASSQRRREFDRQAHTLLQDLSRRRPRPAVEEFCASVVRDAARRLGVAHADLGILRADLGRVIGEHEALVERARELEDARRRLNEMLHTKALMHAEAATDVDHLELAVSALVSERDALTQTSRALESEAADARHQLALVVGSRTWRLRNRIARLLGR